jgi:hypothetical protein
MSLKSLDYHIAEYEKLKQNADKAGKGKGTPVIRFGEVRNECWNCKNFPREIKPKGSKGYYKCEFCGAFCHL